ncbi:cyclin-like protein, partial [Hyaloraphidium curvatum]
DDLDRAQDPDPLHLREYAEEIHRYLKDLELKSKVKRDYLDTQPFITWEMRNDLIDWLMDVAQHLRFHAETVHHTCVLLDLYLSTSTRHVDPIHFQLLGTACFLLAAKVEEIEPPTLSWLVACGDGAFDRESLKIAEINVLDTLGWNVGGFTNISHFLARACRAEALGKTKHIAAYIVELALFERKLLGENPSLVCAAAVWIARKVAGK